MLFHTITFSLFLLLCSTAQYGKKGKDNYRNRFTCSGAPIGDLRFDITELRGRWYNKFLKDTLGTTSGKPTNITSDFVVKPNSNKAEESFKGNNPNTGECLEWRFREFQITKDVSCVSLRQLFPKLCEDEEWVYYIFGKKRNLLFFYYCADQNSGPFCQRVLARCLSRSPYISKQDKMDCQKLWIRFNLGALPDEDLGSANNACSVGYEAYSHRYLYKW